jgi:hypothetical protein
MQRILMALGLCAAMAACSSEKINRGGLGESCTSHNDCSGDLLCYAGVCLATAATPPSSADGGATTPLTPTAQLSKAGESCTKRSDCEIGLGCFSGVCALTAPPPVDAGIIIVTETVYVPIDAGVNTALGGRGETCSKTQDCDIGLICLPLGEASGLGICDVANYGFKTGTMTCGNECEKKEDCCELPLGTTYNSCADLVKAMLPATPATCADQASVSKECFLYKTYCDCATSNPWTCTAGKCAYAKPCDPTVTGEKMTGCPAKTRSSIPLPACNTKTKLCAAAAATGCATAEDCTTSGTSDTNEPCVTNECVCLAEIGRCYRKCNNNLDCRPGYDCDPVKQVCKPTGSCTVGLDAYCAQTLQNVSAKCVAVTAGATVGTCRIPCKIDQDCSPSGLLSTKFNGMVCGADKYCGSIGCTSSAECSAEIKEGTTVLGSVKMFCAANPAVGGIEYASAITD